MKQIAIFMLMLGGIFSQTEGCCFWRSKSKVAPLAEVSKEEIEKMQKAVDKLPLAQVGVMHFNAKSEDFGNATLLRRTFYRGLVANRYEQNKDAIDAMIEDSRDRFRKVLLGPKSHQVHNEIKRRRKAGNDQLPDNLGILRVPDNSPQASQNRFSQEHEFIIESDLLHKSSTEGYVSEPLSS